MVAVVVLTSDRRLTVSCVLALGECMLNNACMYYIGERVQITVYTACFKQDTSHVGVWEILLQQSARDHSSSGYARSLLNPTQSQQTPRRLLLLTLSSLAQWCNVTFLLVHIGPLELPSLTTSCSCLQASTRHLYNNSWHMCVQNDLYNEPVSQISKEHCNISGG